MDLNSNARLVTALRSAGLKLTPQRLAIVDCIADDETHPTAQELYERLKPRFSTLSVATVYNTLSALTSIGACRQISMGGIGRFDPNVTPHDHAVCESCGAMRDVEQGERDGDTQSCSLPGFQVKRVEKVFRGLCAQCARAA